MERRICRQMLAGAMGFLVLVALVGCGGEKPGGAEEEALDLRTVPLEKIEEKAKEEGRLETVAMPDDWTHWDYSWAALKELYGLEHADVDMSSGEEIAIFAAEKDDPTKDLGDVGYGFTITAMEEDVLQPYKVSCWDQIPDWAKDPDGYWTVSYSGSTCFIYNDELTGGKAPSSWQELKDSDIIVNMGNVVDGASSQVNVVACAIAMGGSYEDVRPGIEYFKELAQQGRIDPGNGNKTRLLAGEVQCLAGRFDFNGAAWSEEINGQNQDGVHITATIPQDGAIMTGYAQIINKYAPHPHAAALAMEYLLSEQGQIDRAYGGARPIRSDITLPDDVPLLPDSLYSNVLPVESAESLQAACDEVSRLWQEEVIPLLG